MNRAVYTYAERHGSTMGTTAAMLRLKEEATYIANIGDSRVYVFRDGQLRRLSQEHTDAQLLEDLGVSGRAPRLTQFLGLPPRDMEIEPYINYIKHSPGDRFILCSDGLSSELDDNEIEEICSRSSLAADCASALVAQALERGGRDNVTVLVCDLS